MNTFRNICGWYLIYLIQLELRIRRNVWKSRTYKLNLKKYALRDYIFAQKAINRIIATILKDVRTHNYPSSMLQKYFEVTKKYAFLCWIMLFRMSFENIYMTTYSVWGIFLNRTISHLIFLWIFLIVIYIPKRSH